MEYNINCSLAEYDDQEKLLIKCVTSSLNGIDKIIINVKKM